MTISLNHIGARYRSVWIFRNISYTFRSDKVYAILGPNGSGKSSLMRIIGGMQNPNAGQLAYRNNDTVAAIKQDHLFAQVSYCAPGMEVIEEMTLTEFFHFHFSFKKLRNGYSIRQVIEAIGLQASAGKLIAEYSSGMKQRVKLGQAFFTDTPVLLLDEPCSNLDTQGVALYRQLVQEHKNNRLVIIASNEDREYDMAESFISMSDYAK